VQSHDVWAVFECHWDHLLSDLPNEVKYFSCFHRQHIMMVEVNSFDTWNNRKGTFNGVSRTTNESTRNFWNQFCLGQGLPLRKHVWKLKQLVRQVISFTQRISQKILSCCLCLHTSNLFCWMSWKKVKFLKCNP
jgi:hypothetical protein